MTTRVIIPEIDGSAIDLADSSISDYVRLPDYVRIRLLLWDDSKCELYFENPVAVYECMVGELDQIQLDDCPSGLLATEAALELSGDSERPAKVCEFDILDIDGRVSMRIVCEPETKVIARRV